MNPYAVLGVSAYATDQEIKNAYRHLVKRYHPDRRSPEASHDQIAAINHAYDILSDPAKRARYDRGFTEIFFQQAEQPEDPVEAYKREFKRNRRELEQRQREQKLADRKEIYRYMRWVHILILPIVFIAIFWEFFTLQTITLYHAVMFFNACFIGYQNRYSDFAYKMCFITFVLVAVFLLSLIM